VLNLQADLLGVEVRRSSVRETTALGAAFLAGLAEGFWESLDDLSAQWSADLVVVPTPDRPDLALLTERWTRAVDRAREWAID
jgi:glycerol kinase